MRSLDIWDERRRQSWKTRPSVSDAESELRRLVIRAAAIEAVPDTDWLERVVDRGVPTHVALRELGLELDTSAFAPVETPVSALGLSTRARRALEDGGLTTLGLLARRCWWDLLKIRKLGEKTALEIEQMLAANGILLPWYRPPARWVP